MKLRSLSLSLTLALGAVGAAQAQNLLQIFEAAKAHDFAYAAAKHQALATSARADQAKAALLPTLGAAVSQNQTKSDVIKAAAASDPDYKTQTNALSLSQPLYRAANLASYRQGQHTADLAQAQLSAAEHDLIVRTSQAYFDVLASAEGMNFVQAQKRAVSEQLAAAQRNFEVGTATITDTREAQARYDLVLAQELVAENDLRIKKLALQELAGKPLGELSALQAGSVLQAPEPQDVESWVRTALDNNSTIAQLKVAYEIAKLETDKAKAGHHPTLDLTATLSKTRYTGSVVPTSIGDNNTKVLGLSLNIPLFAGFAVENRIKETVALEEKALADLEAAQTNVRQGTKAAYYGLLSGLGQVKALEAAEASSQMALDANKLGYQVGVRINIDVLNSQSQLYQTKRDLAKARYDVLLGQLKLRQVAGVLKAQDLQPINALLAP